MISAAADVFIVDIIVYPTASYDTIPHFGAPLSRAP
jgi:hypothetical protein